jgi:hypothetical protein
MKAAVIFIIGAFLMLQGVLYTLQGMGIVTWPRQSFMINNHDWVVRGLVMALIGIVVILAAWRLPKKPS